MALAIETRGLTRSFDGCVAVDHIDLAVPRGSIYGFLGPNGAGKTTTIRLLLGLLTPTSGEIRFNNEPFTRDRRALLRRIGALVEGPSLYSNLTAEENLDVTRRLVAAPPARVPEALDAFDLARDARRLVKTFSTGMRQQLALALAWLGEPDLLILDEPANGLDPAAVRRLRAFLTRLAAEGRTVFVSSHVLSEIDQIADWVGIISRGRLVHQGTLAALKASDAGTLEDAFLRIVDAGDPSS